MVSGWIEGVVLLYFIYVAGYTFVFSFAAHFYRNPRAKSGKIHRFAVLIPAYKEDNVIISVADNARKLNYDAASFRVVVIADQLQKKTIDTLRALPVDVVEVSFEQSTKVKSLNKALHDIGDNFDYAVILDADNIVLPDFLTLVNDVHNNGARAVQGQRLPKNMDRNMAFLDGLSEAINNHIYRQGSSALGLSASISGSGVSFDYRLFKELLSGMTSVGGFDRELEILLLKRGVKVVYCKNARVLDEKVEKANVFENQRKRWISSQYHYLGKYFKQGCLALLRGNFTFFNSAVLRNIQLPRLINLGLMTISAFLLYFIGDYLFFGYLIWPLLLGIMALSMLIAIPREFFSRKLLKAILQLPEMFFRMFLLLFRLGEANKKFIHTPHGSSIDKQGTSK
ncbi:MAG TPA: glycosyltransferase family 2 protein [Cyclobacteriaceae bacterium]|nr:glycosyltransferase family 2 protein [Cyclobacteriaceae bacterium]